jgi:hypothetical protein
MQRKMRPDAIHNPTRKDFAMKVADVKQASNALLIAVTVNDDVIGQQIVDFHSQGGLCGPLKKQLAYCTAMLHPDRGGEPFQLSLAIEGIGAARPRLRFEVFDRATHPKLLAAHHVGMDCFFRFGMNLAKNLGIAAEYNINVAVIPPQHPLLEAPADNDADFVVVEEPELTLPQGFSQKPPGPTRAVGRESPGWLKCVFRSNAYNEFREGASVQSDVELGWLGDAHVACHTGTVHVVIESLTKVPTVAAGKCFLQTSPQQVYRLHQEHPQAAAYLHTHPRCVQTITDGKVESLTLLPRPSPSDCLLALNMDATTALPVVFPIALSPLRPESADDILVHGFVDNILVPITMEVLV